MTIINKPINNINSINKIIPKKTNTNIVNISNDNDKISIHYEVSSGNENKVSSNNNNEESSNNDKIEYKFYKLEYKHLFFIHKYDLYNFNKEDRITIKEYIKWFINGLFGFMLYNKYNNEFIGYILYESNKKKDTIDIYIASIVILNNYKNKKISHVLLSFLINRIKTHYKYDKITINCKIRHNNIPSIKLFTHNDFVIYDTKNNWHHLSRYINH